MNTTERIAAFVLELLEQADGTAEFSRAELARRFDCAPSVITYTIRSRFTPEQGYRSEGRPSRGGCIRVTRVPLTRPVLVSMLMDSIGDELPAAAALSLTRSLDSYYDPQVLELLRAAVSPPALRHVPAELRAKTRADILRQMIAHLG